MRKIILRSFLASSIFAFTAAPVLAQDADTETAQKFADPDRLIETVLAGDATDLEATLEELDGALLAAQTDLDTANTDLQQAETDFLQVQTDTADAIQAIDDATAAVNDTQFELGSATSDLETAQGDLAALEAEKAALPTGTTDPDLDAQIAALETQITDVLEPAVVDAGTALQTASDDLLLVEEENADAVQALNDAEGAVDAATTDAGDAQAAVDDVNLKIVAAQDGFGTGSAEITALVEQLTPEQLFALNRSLNDTVRILR